MARVAIMTDSNSGITPQQGAKLGIAVLPMPIIVDGRTFYENVDIFPEEFYRLQAEGHRITSSQPSPASLIEMWGELLENNDEIVYIPMSSGLSGSCAAAEALAKDYGGQVEVVDNHRISALQLTAALDAKAMADSGCSARAIKAVLLREAYDATIYITVDTLTYLRKSGRVTPAAAAVGSLLNIKPVLTIQGGKLDTHTKARGKRAAFAQMVKALKADLAGRLRDFRQNGQLMLAMAGTWMSEEERQGWLDRLQAEFPGEEILYTPLTLSIGCHTGAGALGIGAVRRHPAQA